MIEQGFHNEAAAFFAEALRTRDTPRVRGSLARALVGVRPALYSPPATRTAVLPLAQGYLAGTTEGAVEGQAGAKDLPRCPSSVRGLALLGDRVVVGLADGALLACPLQAEPAWTPLTSPGAPVVVLVHDPAHERLAVARADGSLRVVDGKAPATWIELQPPGGPTLTSLAWSALGLAAGDLAGNVQRWSAAWPPSPLPPLEDVHEGGVAALDWSGERLVTTGYGGGLALIELATGEIKRTSLPSPALALAALGADEVLVGLLSGTVERRRLDTFQTSRSFVVADRPIRSLSVSDDGIIACAGAQGAASQIDFQQETQTRATASHVVYRIPGPGPQDSLSLNARGQVSWTRAKQPARTWSMPGFPTTLARDHSAQIAASGDSRGNVALTLGTGQSLPLLAAHPGRALISLRFSDNGRRFLTAVRDEIAIWDTATQRTLVRRAFNPPRHVVEADLSRAGTQWAVRFDNKRTLLHAADGKETLFKNTIAGPCFGPAGVPEAGTGERIWCATLEGVASHVTEDLLYAVIRESLEVRSIKISRSGYYCLITRSDGVACLYKVKGRRLLARYRTQQVASWPPEIDEQSRQFSLPTPEGAAGLWDGALVQTGNLYQDDVDFSRVTALGENAFAVAGTSRLIIYRWTSRLPVKRLRTPGRTDLIAFDPASRRIGACGRSWFAEFDPVRGQASRTVALPKGFRPLTLCYWPTLKAWLMGDLDHNEILIVDRKGGTRLQSLTEAGQVGCSLLERASPEALLLGGAGGLHVFRPKTTPGPQLERWKLGPARVLSGAVFTPQGGFAITSWTPPRAGANVSMQTLRGELWSLMDQGKVSRLQSHSGAALALAYSPASGLMAWIGGSELYLYDVRQGALLAVLRGLLPSDAGGVGLVWSKNGEHLVAPYELTRVLKAWNLRALGLFDTPAEAVKRVERLTRLRVVGLQAINQPEPHELELARRLARAAR
ncbi:MAG: WD40 repeat domain-containing protein [Planctomycetes bacterium]|nr:WD40 repeat domain-containing protein [Planctomycetota bacterium]